MDYKVKVRYLRIGRRKVARLLPFVKGEYVNHAISNLATMPQMSSVVLRKAIKSGIANAIFQSRNINPDTLWVKTAYVDKAPTLKRIRAASRGSADPILKRLSHITIILSDDKKPEKKKLKAKSAKTEEAPKAAEV
ncbi:50S ribosomal protein L22 [Brachyspira hyodysenteriae]|uniref:Large ribosomal subunit protein uL22 n=3 Tax=Brachyspira TaxID=29521 RepID=A0A1E5NBH8_9SPIR|nr:MULTISPECIES: 50S ribosomal protein L22 [Brachyspira]AEM23147.1 50S ribosomal protein L22 [Brachyspira intermedia PWS/A]KLI13846.1 50S ribosomal protein L22 [Brachyspira hyodysenteriae]KLI32208.1 50S ribosomal protein L22 [Brachyspira hyodysenteriae]KLI46025.1 50S ribosomal protein L22 [Brachyspira hyodysenteriae]KLI51793.1 50S ribosomal protein L22 [Brachyspira hyodysenteriae]